MKGRKERGERERREVGKVCKQRREVTKNAVGGNSGYKTTVSSS